MRRKRKNAEFKNETQYGVDHDGSSCDDSSTGIEAVSAPYSSVEKGALEDKTYSNVTANIFVAGRDNILEIRIQMADAMR